MSDPSSENYGRRRTLMEQIVGNGPGSTRSEASIRMAQRQVAARQRWGEMDSEGRRT